MESCIFSYYIRENDITIQELTNRYSFGKYIVQTDSKTFYTSDCNDRCECAVFGVAVDVLTRESKELASKIISCCSSIFDVIAFEKKLGGKYVILYREKESYYILGDATCSIPVFYTIGKEFACTSNSQYLVDHYGCLPDKELQQIRDSCDISQAMPYDITQYCEIKQLIPNHYLSLNHRMAIRFINAVYLQPALTVKEATEIVMPMITAISDYYKSIFKIYCPITSGRDSRVVLAFLAGSGNPVQCYTIRHPEYRDNAQDILIPKQLCEENNLPYEQIGDSVVTAELKKATDHLLGKNHYSFRTLQIAQTVREKYKDGAVINGDIIGQIGKCSLHRDISLCFATPGYFRCKLHNYSREAKKQLRLWIQEIKSGGECVNIFDLFSIENRMGRWAGQENLIYNSLGQVYLNIFNSRSIIYVWTAVSRKERKKSKIHMSLIEKKMPSLRDVAFETDESIIFRLSKVNGLTYLISSYAKYYIERMKFKRGNCHEIYEEINNYCR